MGLSLKRAGKMLSAAVTKLLSKKTGTNVYHDQSIRRKISQTLYQIDVFLEEQGHKKMGEAKDYTIKNAKVGRGNLQKMVGALIELDVNGGMFFSATEYTAPVKRYAQAAQSMINKPIFTESGLNKLNAIHAEMVQEEESS